MNDLDFDELDRAVSNTLNNANDKGAKKSTNKDENTDTPADTPAEPPQPAYETKKTPDAAPQTDVSAPNDSSKTEEPENPTSPPPIVKPRTSINRTPRPAASKGGAVDIVAPPSKKPSRKGASIAPSRPVDDVQPATDDPKKPSGHDVSVPERGASDDPALRWPPRSDAAKDESALQQPAAEEASAPAATPNPENTGAPNDEGSFERFEALSRSGFDFDEQSSPSEAKPETEQDTTEGAIPDIQAKPVDEPASTEATEEAAAPEQPAVDDQAAAAPHDVPDMDEKPDEAPQSPFLSDAKVEKRPLGSYSSPSTPEETMQPQPEESVEASQPDEAAGQQKDAADTAKSEEPQAMTDHLLGDGHEHEQASQAPAPTNEATDKKDVAQDAPAMGSIPQQYKVAGADKKDDEAAHPVFDTKEYHAPVTGGKKAKNRSGNLFLVISIILLILAIAAAVGIYFYGEQIGLSLLGVD